MKILVDTREGTPWTFDALRFTRWPHTVETATLHTGDYTAVGLEDSLLIERKALDDFIGSISSGRDRFEREMQRAHEFIQAGGRVCVLVEGSREQIAKGHTMSRMNPHAIMCTTFSWWRKYNVPFHFCGSRDAAEYQAFHLLRLGLESLD